MKLKILGSVSPYPTQNNNCIGYLITENKNKILLDCGNGITKLLKFPDDLKDLIIIISHLHKDHYGDLNAIAYASYVYHKLGYIKEKIKVYIPKDLGTPDYTYLINYGNEHYFEFITYDDTTHIKIEDISINFQATQHQILTYAINIIKGIQKISYSSDTGYSDDLVDFFKESDLLICESSFLEYQKNNNIYHLSAKEAALLAKKSNVKKLILTHFWPEINKQEYINEAKEYYSNVEASEEGKEYKLTKKY